MVAEVLAYISAHTHRPGSIASMGSATSATSSLVSRSTLVNQLGMSRMAASKGLRGSPALSVAAPRASFPAAVKNVHQRRTKPTGSAGAAQRVQREGFVHGNI